MQVTVGKRQISCAVKNFRYKQLKTNSSHLLKCDTVPLGEWFLTIQTLCLHLQGSKCPRRVTPEDDSTTITENACKTVSKPSSCEFSEIMLRTPNLAFQNKVG